MSRSSTAGAATGGGSLSGTRLHHCVEQALYSRLGRVETLPDRCITHRTARPRPSYERENEMSGMRTAGGRRRWQAALLFTLLAALTFGAVSGSAGGSTKLFMLPKFTGIPPFTQADNGAKEIGKGFGYTLDYGGPTTSSATQQVQFVDNAVSKGYNGIFISADNPAAVTPALQRARQHGVTVVSYDSDVLPAGRSVYVEGTSADDIALYQLEMLGSQIGYKGDFVILSAQATDTNQVTWNKLLVNDHKTMPKYKNMHLLKIINPPDDSTPSAVQYAQSILKEYPSIKGIIAPTTIAVGAAAQVVQQQDVCDKGVVTGLGDPKQMEGYVKSGCV